MLLEEVLSTFSGRLVRSATLRDPSVSVVLPTYNRGSIVPQSIRSALALNERNLEIIVVDDGSQDQTTDILAELDDPRLSVINLSKNHGAGFARNAGVALARAPYVAFLDSDDLYLPGRIERPLSILERHANVGIVLSAFTTEKKNKHTQFRMPRRQFEGCELERLVARHVLQPTTSGLTLRRDLLIAIGGFDTSLVWMEDRDLVMRAARHAGGATLDEPLWHKRWQPDAISSNHTTYFPSLLNFLTRHPIYQDEELGSRNYLIARHLVKAAYHSGFSTALSDYQKAFQQLFPRLPPLPILLTRYLRTRRSRRFQQRKLHWRDAEDINARAAEKFASL